MRTYQTAEHGCSDCQQSCAGKWFAAPARAPGMQVTPAQVGLSGAGLTAVVMVLFGLPLLLLLGLGAVIQFLGLSAAPLLSLVGLSAALLALGAFLMRQGTKLLPLLRVEVLSSPDLKKNHPDKYLGIEV